MLHNSGIVSIVLFASQLLAIVQQCVANQNTTWMCKDNQALAFRAHVGSACNCLFVPQLEPPNLGEGYVEKQGIGIYKLHKVGKTWNDARKICHNEGAYLAVIDSPEEMEALSQIFAEQYGDIRDADVTDLAYLGVHMLYEHNEWETVAPGKGDWKLPQGFKPWFQTKNGEKCERWGDQPNNYDGKQKCAALIRPCRAMDDNSCYRKFAFFCEKPKQCP